MRACRWLYSPNSLASVAHWPKVFLPSSGDLPHPDHAHWMLTQMRAARQLPEERVSDAYVIERAYQPAT